MHELDGFATRARELLALLGCGGRGCPVGTLWLLQIEKIPNPVAEAENHGYIRASTSAPPCRGAGLGSRLLDTCLQVCTAEGLDAVILWPSPRSRRLYERHGFAVRDDLFERRLGPAPSHAGVS